MLTTNQRVFYAHGAGIVPTYQATSWNQQVVEWRRMQEWCNEQGWVKGEDYFASAEVPNGKFLFKNADNQVWFKLRWG